MLTNMTEMEVRQRLNLPGDGTRATGLDADEALQVLRELASDVQHAQHAIGMVLWHLDPRPEELAAIAEKLGLKVTTLKSWLTTYSTLRHDARLADVAFSMQQQLARIANPEDRQLLWLSRSDGDWTLAALTEAVDAHMESIGASVMPRTKKAGCKARYGDGRQVKANLELMKNAVVVELTVSEGSKLGDLKFEEVSEGKYRLKFDW